MSVGGVLRNGAKRLMLMHSTTYLPHERQGRLKIQAESYMQCMWRKLLQTR
jgi:hypothetical protein